MTAQYGVRVLANEGARIELQVLSISEDTPVPPDVRDVDAFLRFLCEGPDRKRSALLTRIESDGGNPFDDAWVNEHGHRYIGGVEQLSSKNLDAEGRFSSYDARKRRFVAEASLAQASFRVTLTDERLAAQLEPGDAWESSAYASGLSYAGTPVDGPTYVMTEADYAGEDAQEAEEVRLAAEHIAQVDAALASAGIVVWRTSELSSGAYHVILHDGSKRRAAIKAMKGVGFALVGTQYGESSLTCGATHLKLDEWKNVKVRTYLVGKADREERPSFPEQALNASS